MSCHLLFSFTCQLAGQVNSADDSLTRSPEMMKRSTMLLLSLKIRLRLGRWTEVSNGESCIKRLLCIFMYCPCPSFSSFQKFQKDTLQTRLTSLTALEAFTALSTFCFRSSASFAVGREDTQGGTGSAAATGDVLTISLREPVVQDDLVCRRIIVFEGEIVSGIGGGMVGRRYLGVPRA